MWVNSLGSWTQKWYPPSWGKRARTLRPLVSRYKHYSYTPQSGRQESQFGGVTRGCGRPKAELWFVGRRWHGKGRETVTSPVWLTLPLLQDPGTGSRVSIDLSAYSRHTRGRDVLATREEPLVVTATQRVPRP